MLNLETTLRIDLATTQATNLAGRFSEVDQARLADYIWQGYSNDLQSRSQWERRMQAAMDLALQLQKDKSFPWANSSNVAFPLITIATLQFHSRAYPALVSGPEIVKYRVMGEDPRGEEKARALRIGAHMSYQILEEDQSWEEQHDRLLINLPIVGCAFKKSFHSASLRSNKSELVLAKDFVLDYYAKSVETCARKTHVIPLSRNEMYEKMLLGVFNDYTEEEWFQQPARVLEVPGESRTDQRDGVRPPPADAATPFTTLEQHCWLDLDGDGYAEPYIVTIEGASKKLLRVVARWERMEDVLKTSAGRIYSIRATEYFTKYTFIPAPDSSIYDLGFGILLGPLNESVNTAVNQIFDAGTMATTGGGFLGRGAKIRGGKLQFAPLEWKTVDATGDDLRKSIFPLPVREPSPVLFNLLSLLINYTERISGSTDIMVGENIGQNTPKGTADMLVEQGSKIYSAIFKRVWRAMKEEFKKLYALNGIYLPSFHSFGAAGAKALREDYLGDPSRLVPAADPNVVSDAARLQQAIMLKGAAAQTPGYDLEQVERNFLRANKVDGIDLIYPGPGKIPAPPNPRIQLEEMKLKAVAMKLEQQKTEFLISMMEEQRVNSAQILKLEAEAKLTYAEVDSLAKQGKIAAFEASIGALKAHDEGMRHRIELALQERESNQTAQESSNGE